MLLNIGSFITSTFKNGNYMAKTAVSRERSIAGMQVTEDNRSESCQKMITVPEEHRQKLFDMVKEEFIKENGVANAGTSGRSSVYREYQLSIGKGDRLDGTWSMQQYEEQYMKALESAVRAVDSDWKPGKKFDTSILSGITRESVESLLVQRENMLVRKRIDCAV